MGYMIWRVYEEGGSMNTKVAKVGGVDWAVNECTHRSLKSDASTNTNTATYARRVARLG